MTTMWHIGTGLPWDWRVGPGDSSERAHLRQMLAGLPAKALVTADGGFVGYEGLQAIVDSGRHALLRVGANVRLLKKLGYARESVGTVYLWPDRETKRGNHPLVLRLVVASDGKQPVYLVTNIRSPRELSDRQVIELYARRWGIELFYRHLKQTFRRRKLLSREAENAKLEITWSLFGLWAMSLFALAESVRQGIAPAQ
ncbi:transposase, partial [Aeoliella straminimaris]|uniref:transposase n=1 Tax=Aeoliella straminimaris TaxID=2954799 RepID=UPI0031342B2D